MKQLIILLLILWQGPHLFAQQGKRYIKKGNELYQQQKYTEAEANYRKSVDPKSTPIEANFNIGDALFKQKKFPQANTQFSQIAESPNSSKAVKAQAYHNLGNSYLQDKKLEEGIAAYKKSLLNNPKDDETRYNLAYAQEMLKKQQQQKNKDDKNKDKDKQKKHDKNKDPNKDKKDQDKKDQDKKDQDKDKQNKGDQQKDQGGQKPDPGKLSKEDAERMLDALNNKEKDTQDKLKNKKFKAVKGRISKDW
jgi:Ca-activated chloride channel family protein